MQRYDIHVDLRGLLEGEVWASTSTITFTSSRPGASTFVDCVAEVRSATLNGRDLDLGAVAGGRIPLPDLAADNVLVVEAAQRDTGSGSGILRTVDPSDELVYVWTSFEADDARRAWACFDQPDLKAPHAFTVLAPAAWTVTSNSAPGPVEDRGRRRAGAGRSRTRRRSRRTSWWSTPARSTSCAARPAGTASGCTAASRCAGTSSATPTTCSGSPRPGLAFFGERFGQPFPQERYDQVFVPNLGGAMENWGCVTWTDTVLFRSPPTHGQRAMVASVLLHEMAHMWFGDLVTMRWWDDLWLNEAFASWAATWAGVHATEFTDAWASFLAADEIAGYATDMGPASHPIRGEVPDVAHAMANFDAITYVKGQAVLRQLVATVGEDTFVEGLRAYFRDPRLGQHPAGGPDGGGRHRGRPGPVVLDAGRGSTGPAPTRSRWSAARCSRPAPAAGRPAPHHLGIGSFRLAGDDGLEPVRHDVRRHLGSAHARRRPARRRPAPASTPSDLTFAAVRTDERSLRTMLERAGALPDPLSRALAVTTAWDMLVKGELATDDVLGCVLGVLGTERSPGVVEPFLALALRAAELWTRPGAVPDRLERVARAGRRAGRGARAPGAGAAHAGRGVRPPRSTSTLLEQAAADDVDLAWRVLVRRAALGEYDADAVAALLERDPDPDASAAGSGGPGRPARRRTPRPRRGPSCSSGGRCRPGRRPTRWRPPSGARPSTSCCCPGRTATSTRSSGSAAAAACSR